MASRGSSSTSHNVSTSRALFQKFGFSSDCCAFSNLDIFARRMLVSWFCVSSKRERQRHGDHGDRPRCWRWRNLHAFCSHGPLLQVSPEYQHEREICTFFASKKNFFLSTFLSFISPAAHRHLFLSARQFCRIRPQPISISVHHRAAFLTLLQNFATFLDAFLVVQQLGEFSFPLTETSGGSKE